MKEYPDNYFDLAIVDPPYGIGEDGKSNHSRNQLTKATQYLIKNWDNKIPSPEYFIQLQRVSRHQIIWGANYYPKYLTPSMGWIFWNKEASGDFSDGELAYTSFNRALKKFNFAWMGMRQQDMKNKEKRIHPTQKPVQLYKWILKNYAKPTDKILDTHVGSGSSLIAFEDYGCEYVGFEIDKDYYNSALKRLNQHKAQLTIF